MGEKAPGWIPKVIEGGGKDLDAVQNLMTDVTKVFDNLPVQFGDYSIDELAEYDTWTTEALVTSAREILRQINSGSVNLEQPARLKIMTDALTLRQEKPL